MKRFKRFVAGVLCVSFTMLAAACGAPADNNTSSGGSGGGNGAAGVNVPMGRYVETTIDLPEELNGDLRPRPLVNPDGILELYSFTATGEKELAHWRSDGNNGWERMNDPWLKTLGNIQGVWLITMGADGSTYLYIEDEKYQHHLYRASGDTAEEIVIPSWAEGDANGAAAFITNLEGGSVAVGTAGGADSDSGDADSDGGEAAPSGETDVSDSYSMGTNLTPMSMDLLENGDILINFMSGGPIRYNKQGEVVKKYPVSYAPSMAVAGSKAYIYTYEGDQIRCFDLDTGAEENAIPLENTAASNPGALFSDGDGNLYAANSGGIHRLVPGGGVWETVLDGALSALNAPSIDLSAAFTDRKGGFYLSYFSQSSGMKLSHAVYDENTPSVPSKELTVYSLRENKTVRQSIVNFQANNPDVMVNYQVGFTDNTSVIEEDVIRDLNKEILAGKGPDVLILDGLPIDSYMEKGVLADLAGAVDSLGDSYIQTILNTFRRDGKLYAVPGRFMVPMMFGSQEVLDSLNALSDLADSPDKSLMNATTAEMFMDTLAAANYPAWIGADGRLDTVKLTEFLTAAKGIFDKYGMKLGDSMVAMSTVSASGGGAEISLGPDFIDFSDGKTKVMLANAGSLNYISMVASFRNDSEKRSQFASMPGQSSGTYVPTAIAGVNAAGKQQDLAAAFIKTMLSTDVQYLTFNDGFSVNETASDKQVAGYRQRLKEAKMEDVDYNAILKPLFSSLTTPVVADTTLMKTVQEAGVRVLQGEQTVEEAVSAVQKVMELRLAE